MKKLSVILGNCRVNQKKLKYLVIKIDIKKKGWIYGNGRYER